MQSIIDGRDWTSTALGHPDSWPRSLKNTLQIMLASRFPMWIGWGPELTFFCNDAYLPTVGARKDWVLGAPSHLVWEEIWPIIGPRIEHVLKTGQATWDERLMLFLERSGFPEETYHTFSYSPLFEDPSEESPDEPGRVAGFVCVVTEETERVIGERRLALLREMANSMAVCTTKSEVLEAVAHVLKDSSYDLPLVRLYLQQDERDEITLGLSLGADCLSGADDIALREVDRVVREKRPPILWSIEKSVGLQSSDQMPRQAVIVPLYWQGLGRAMGALLAGINPHLPFDDAYRGFIDLVAAQIATSFLNARDHEVRQSRVEAVAAENARLYGDAKEEIFRRAAVEKALRESEARFRIMADTVPSILFSARPDGHRDFFNRRFYELTGMSEAAAEGLGWLSAFHPEDIDRARASWLRSVETGEPWVSKHRLRRRDGQYRWISAKAIPIRDESEHITKWFGSATDIDEIVQAQEALRKSERRFSKFMQHLPGLAWIKDAEGKYVFANEAAQRALGKEPDELYGYGDEELFDEATARRLSQNDKNALESPSGIETVEAPFGKDASHHAIVSKFAIPGVEGMQTLIGGMAIDITDRVRAETALRESDERLRLATKTGKVGVWDWDILANRITWSDSLYEIHGLQPGQFDGTVEEFTSFVHPEDRAYVAQALNEAVKNDAPYQIEFRAVRPDGKTIWIYTNASVIREGGRTVRLIGATLDITGRKTAERARARLAAIVESSADAVISKDLNGQITSWNASAERIFGYSADEVVGRSIMLLIPKGQEAEEEEILSRLRCGDQVKHFQTTRLSKDGRTVDVSLSLSPIRDDRGHIVGASSVARDITDQVRIERELRDNEQRYRQLVNAIPAAVYTCDASGKILLFNDAAVELWGRRPEPGELWCGSMRIFTPTGEPVDLSTCPMAIALKEGRSVRDEEIVIERPDGTRRNVLPHPRPMFDAAGTVVGAVNMLLDITDRKLSEQELASTKDDLAAQVQTLTRVHDLAGRLGGGTDLKSALQAVLETLVDAHDAQFGLLSLSDGTSGCLTPAAHEGFTAEMLAHVQAVPVGPASGACGSAFATGQRVVIEDVEADPRFADYLGFARQAGFRAVHSTPISLRSGEVVGVLTVQFQQRRSVSQREMQLADLCARYAGDVIEAFQAKRALIDANEQLEARVRVRTAELAQANAKFKAIWDQGVFAGLIGLDGSLLDVNRSFLEQGSYAREDVIGKPFWETGWWNRSPAAVEWLKSGFQQAARGRPFHGESVYFLADGSERIVDFAFMPIKDEHGEVEFIVPTGIDITDRRRAEEERQAAEVLRESEERFRQVADHAPVLIWLHGPDGCEFVNREYLRFVGRTQEHVRGVNWQKFIHPDDLRDYLRIYHDAFERGLPFNVLARFLREDGEYRWLNSTGSPRFNTDGSVLGYVGCSVDITEIKRSEDMLKAAKEAAEAASQSKDRFLAILSHELRTPLTPVLMSAASMKNDPSLPAQTRDDLSMIHRNVELETMLIDDLLDLSRITTGKLRLQSRPIQLNDAVRSVCQICGPQVAEKSIQQKVELDPRVGSVIADPARLQQVLWNVLKNAVKFTPEGGEIQVSTSVGENGAYRVIIRDNGVGIAAENLGRIFLAFDQGDSRMAHQFGGLGLGLAISKALIELLNGTIRAESRGLGTGATFMVELPANTTSGEVHDAKKPPPDAGQTVPLRLLVVEDHPDTARILSRMLRNLGYVVTTAHRASKALELVSNEPFDVLVSDVGLPDATGYELMTKINELHPMKGIAMSGYGMDDDIRRSRESGFGDHLVKPVDIVQLDKSIRKVAGLSD